MTTARGFTAMTMLFILVALAALGAALASLSQRQQLGSAGELAAARAYQAALAGLEWGSWQVLSGPAGTPQPACFATKSIALADQLAGFAVTVSCTRTPSSGTVSDGDQNLAFYALQATACNLPAGGACPNGATAEPTYVERQLLRTLSR
ncbi:agglutinin biogenesis protein MshP [Roseateles sp.]|uniref:agglutinin biogenesis protein MshP n=1 Tax=Roseateles sp. TaxID=1971397 RepID=UPI0026012396|nr:agglutinin biogenesis protein MshP [Roseateles sp.]MBV8035717.1 agglutinin biogenesis protein MshP [Roseateles sp.]